jgi:UDP-glucose 4-epimerase
MKKVLVTGGLGFIGSHLVDHLVDVCGHRVTVIDNLCSESSSRDHIRNDVEYWVDDVRNLNSYTYKDCDFDLVYHLAALARIQPSFENPLKYLDADIMGTSHVCEFARNRGSNLVYAGSSSAHSGPMLNPYAFAKFTGEQVCELYNKVYGMSTVTARFFNVYGFRQPTRGAHATVVGIFERQASIGAPLTVTGTGTQRRDFTHVSDIVKGIAVLGDSAWSAEIFQLGTGRNYAINELANMFGGEIEYVPDRPGEAYETLANFSEMRERTGWQPQVVLEDYILSWKNKNLP